MKHLIIILAFLTACKKETTERVQIAPPQTAVYVVISRTDSKKHIRCELWSTIKGERVKKTPVGVIDTITTAKNIRLTLTNSENPVMYVVANLSVQILEDDYDTLGISIGNEKKVLTGRGTTCAVNYYEITDEYLNLLINND